MEPQYFNTRKQMYIPQANFAKINYFYEIPSITGHCFTSNIQWSSTSYDVPLKERKFQKLRTNICIIRFPVGHDLKDTRLHRILRPVQVHIIGLGGCSVYKIIHQLRHLWSTTITVPNRCEILQSFVII